MRSKFIQFEGNNVLDLSSRDQIHQFLPTRARFEVFRATDTLFPDDVNQAQIDSADHRCTSGQRWPF
jgi:hypothetical protein